MVGNSFPFAVRLIGFTESEEGAFDSAFASERESGYRYIRLEPDNLRDPDLFIANAAELKAMIRLANLHPSTVRPALLVGQPTVELPYPHVAYPVVWNELLQAVDALMDKRADALSSLQVSDIVAVPERRRTDRLDLDLTDPTVYEKMRAKIPENGAVLVVDKSSVLSNYLSGLLERQRVPVAWVSDEMQTVEFCKQQPVAVVMINTATPDVDPYRLCWAIKEKDAPLKISIIFLINKPFEYDVQQARYVGADGFLIKPVSGQQLVAVLKKFLPL